MLCSDNKALRLLLLCFCVTLLAAWLAMPVLFARTTAPDPKPAGLVEPEGRALDWNLSDEVSPPEYLPVVGAWAEGGLRIEATIYWYDSWYEYAPTLVPPVGGLIAQSPPDWWAPMPGRAR